MEYKFTAQLRSNEHCIAEYDCKCIININRGQIEADNIQVEAYGARDELGNKIDWVDADQVIRGLALAWLRGPDAINVLEVWDEYNGDYIDYREAV